MLEKDLLSELKLYKAAVIAADQAEAEMLEDYTSEEKEVAFDSAYAVEYDQCTRCAGIIVDLVNGKMDILDARQLVRYRADYIIDLLTA